MNGSDTSTTFTDDSPSPLTVTANGTAQIDTAQSKFGGASGIFALNAYLTTNDTAEMDMGTGDFTVDFWIRFASVGEGQRIFSIGTYNSSGISCFFAVSGNLQFYINSSTATYDTLWGPSINTWYHVAIARSGSTAKVFIDGTQLGSDITDSTSLSTTSGIYVSAWDISTSDGLNGGWLDEFRVSKGVARWTSDFTPPTSEYCGTATDISGMFQCFE